MSKMRVRLCLKDVYRFIAIGKTTPILGITDWNATKNSISVKYEGNKYFKRYDAFDEEARRRVIKHVNKRISEVH